MLQLYELYSRNDVQNIFDPNYQFEPSRGTWGLHGVVRIPHKQNDWVFFVTYGQSQSGHEFDEGITPDGVLTWQSDREPTRLIPFAWLHPCFDQIWP